MIILLFKLKVLGHIPKSNDPYVKDFDMNLWLPQSILHDDVSMNENENELWTRAVRNHRSRVRYLRYQEFIDRQQQKGLVVESDYFLDEDIDRKQYSSTLQDQFYQKHYSSTLPQLSIGDITKGEEHIPFERLKKDYTLSKNQIRSFKKSFSSGLWTYLNHDHTPIARANNTKKVENLPIQPPQDNHVQFDADARCMVEQCQEMAERYLSSKSPIGRHLTEVSSSSNNQRTGRGLTLPQRGEFLHITTIFGYMTKLVSSILDEKSNTIAYANIVNTFFNSFLLQGVLFDPAICKFFLIFKNGNAFRKILELRATMIEFAKDADRDMNRSPNAGWLFWEATSTLTNFLAKSLVTLTIAGGPAEDIEVASTTFTEILCPELMKSCRPNEDVWYTEENSAWVAMLQHLKISPKKVALRFIKKHWDLIESTCKRNLDEIKKKQFDNERIRVRENLMAQKTAIDIANNLNSICFFDTAKASHGSSMGMGGVIPGEICKKFLKKGAVSLLIKLARSSNSKVGGEAMSGLGQLSRFKDCRDIIFQLPDHNGLKLIQEGMTSNHAYMVSATMLIVLHLSWDEAWHQPLRSMKPRLEDMIMKWAAFSMHSILQTASKMRGEEASTAKDFYNELDEERKMDDQDQEYELFKHLDYLEDRLEEPKNKVLWTELEEKMPGMECLTLGRCLLLLQSALFQEPKMIARLEKTDFLHIVNACIDSPDENVRNGLTNVLHNYAPSHGRCHPPSPSLFPEPLTLVEGLIRHYYLEQKKTFLGRLEGKEYSPTLDSLSLIGVIVRFHDTPEWKSIFDQVLAEDEAAKKAIDSLVSKFPRRKTNEEKIYNRGPRIRHLPKSCTSSGVLAKCSGCDRVEERRGEWKKCSRCLTVQYCGSNCQKSHWKAHKKTCKSI